MLRSQMYASANRRVTGKLLSGTGKSYWKGLEIMSRDKFHVWFNDKKWKIKKMLFSYLESGKDRSFSISLHRINSSHGYLPWNIDVVTQGENSRIGGSK